MATKIFKIHEWISEKLIKVHQVKGTNNVADFFTKIDKHFIKYRDTFLQLRGSVRDSFLTEASHSCNTVKEDMRRY